MWTRTALLKMIAGFCLAFTLSSIAVSCNTMEGAGKDIEQTGDSLKDAARDAKN